MLQNALIQLLKAPQAKLIYEGQTFSVQQIVTRTLALIPDLKKIQSHSERLAFCLPNSPELLCYHLACFYLGLTIVPIIYEQEASYIQQVIQETEANCLITDTAKNKSLTQSRLHFACQRIITDEQTKVLAATPSKPMSFLQPSQVKAEDLSIIIFSSGTSGKLHGIMHSYQSFWGFMQSLNEVLAVDTGLTYLVAQPMGHIGGIITTLLTLMHNGTAILMRTFEVSPYLQAMADYLPTHINLDTPQFYALINYPELKRKDFSHVKTCFASGDDMPAGLAEEFRALTGAPMRRGYGRSEIGIVTVNPEPYGQYKGSCGKIITLVPTEISLRNEAGAPVTQGNTGEIWARSPACCLGYWKMPILNKKILAEQFFKTGDLASQDSQGNYWYKGRVNQVILRHNNALYPQLIEQVLYRFPGIKVAAVVGIHNLKDGEVPIAFIELKSAPQSAHFKTNLINYLSQSLKDWQLPKKIIILQQLPINLSGKIDRRKLQKIYLEQVTVS